MFAVTRTHPSTNGPLLRQALQFAPRFNPLQTRTNTICRRASFQVSFKISEILHLEFKFNYFLPQ